MSKCIRLLMAKLGSRQSSSNVRSSDLVGEDATSPERRAGMRLTGTSVTVGDEVCWVAGRMSS